MLWSTTASHICCVLVSWRTQYFQIWCECCRIGNIRAISHDIKHQHDNDLTGAPSGPASSHVPVCPSVWASSRHNSIRSLCSTQAHTSWWASSLTHLMSITVIILIQSVVWCGPCTLTAAAQQWLPPRHSGTPQIPVKSDSVHPKAKTHGLQTPWRDLLPAFCPVQLNIYTIFRELDLLLWMIRVYYMNVDRHACQQLLWCLEITQPWGGNSNL